MEDNTFGAGTSTSNTAITRKRRYFESEDEPAPKVLIEDRPCSLLSFCDEILLEIIKHLDTNSIIALGKTCSRLYTLSADHRLWRNVDLLSEGLTLQEIHKRLIFIHSDTQSICIRGMTEQYPKDAWKNSTISEPLLKLISEMCPLLQTLEIHQGFMNLEKVFITDFPSSIKRLVFNKCFVKFPKQLNAFFTRIDLHFMYLEELILEQCNWFETHDLVLFSKIKNLKKLSLRGCDNLKECVPYGSIATRFGFRKLEVLDVRDTPISDSDIQCFNITLTLKVLFLECPEDLRDPETSQTSLQSQGSSSSRQRASTRRIINNSNDQPQQNDDDNLFHIVVNDYSFINVNLPRGNARPNVEVRLINPERDIVAVINDPQQPPPDPHRAISRSLWFERRYPPPFSPPRIHPISDRGICSFGSPRNQVQEGVVWIRAEPRPPDVYLEKLVVRHYKLVTDTSLCHLALCTPSLVYLDLTGTSVTLEGVENFKRQKPQCYIKSDHFTG